MPDDWDQGTSVDSRIVAESLIVDVDGFEGPLDLLLMLSRTQKVDLRRISVLQLAEQYLGFVNQAKALRIELAADYLVMAAWLAYLKSRLLIPVPPGSEEQEPADLAARLGGSRRRVKVALLDQRAVAGIGNIYASEILHRAAIDPRTPCHKLSTAAWGEVAAAARGILASAVAHEGSSIGDELYRTADNRKGGFQALHRVYGLADTPCQTCGGPIERIVQAQRSTFFCATCQPKFRSGRRRAGSGQMGAKLVRRGARA